MDDITKGNIEWFLKTIQYPPFLASFLLPRIFSHSDQMRSPLKLEKFDPLVSIGLIMKLKCQFIAYHHNGIIPEGCDKIKSSF